MVTDLLRKAMVTARAFVSQMVPAMVPAPVKGTEMDMENASNMKTPLDQDKQCFGDCGGTDEGLDGGRGYGYGYGSGHGSIGIDGGFGEGSGTGTGAGNGDGFGEGAGAEDQYRNAKWS